MCHPWLWEALAGVSENSALLNPLRPHVPDCTAWPSMASLRARPRDARIYEEDEREKEGCVKKDSALGKDGLGSGDRTVYLL